MLAKLASRLTTRRALLVIVLFSVAARVAAALIMGNAVDTLPGVYDQVSYHTLAVRLLTGHGFTFAQDWWPITRAGQPTAHWSYLYTVWLAALYAVVGVQPIVPRLIQAILVGALLPWLVFRLARRVFPAPPGGLELTALIAAAWAGGYGYLAYYAGALMTEGFYIVGLLWVLECTLRLAPAEGGPARPAPAPWRLWVELGLALGLTALLRQVFLPCVPVLLGWLYWQWMRTAGPLRAVAGRLATSTALAGLVTFTLIAPVTLFNYRQFHRFVLLNTNAGYAFFWANHPIYGDRFVAVLTEVAYTDLIPPELRGLDEAALDNALLQRGLQFVQADPARYLRLSLSRIPIYFMFWPSANSGTLSNVVRVLSFGLALPFMLLGFGVWVSTSRGRRGPGGLLLLFIAAYTALHLLSWSLIRYRLPVDAIALAFAARGVVALLGRWGRAPGPAPHPPRRPQDAMTQAQSLTLAPPRTVPPPAAPFRVAVVQWMPYDGMAHAIYDALVTLGHAATLVDWNQPLPRAAQVVFSQGPYGHFLEVPYQLGRRPVGERPVLVHWNDEGLPDLKLPWPLMRTLGGARSWLGRLPRSASPAARALAQTPPVRWINGRLHRFSYLGDYHFAYQQGWLTLLVDFSKIYARLHSEHGLPTLAVPWGSVPGWFADLGLERDIDVLWMGARAGRRRGSLLDRIRGELRALGVEMYVADSVERPFIFGDERTRLLNRAKITLNLTRTWYDDNFLRFPIVMPNRSLVVSEPLLPHCTDYVAGTHYVSAPIPELARTMHHYLQNEAERRRLVEQAHHLVTTTLTLENCVARIMAAVAERVRPE